MRNYRTSPSRRTPPPDVVRASPTASLAIGTPSAQPQSPDWLIIGLFALRLTKCMLEGLDQYPGRDADIAWLTDFLVPYLPEYALAKISGSRKNDYIATYQRIVSRMKRQPRYPMRFMQMNPDPSQQPGLGRREPGGEGLRNMTDCMFNALCCNLLLISIQMSDSTS